MKGGGGDLIGSRNSSSLVVCWETYLDKEPYDIVAYCDEFRLTAVVYISTLLRDS